MKIDHMEWMKQNHLLLNLQIKDKIEGSLQDVIKEADVL